MFIAIMRNHVNSFLRSQKVTAIRVKKLLYLSVCTFFKDHFLANVAFQQRMKRRAAFVFRQDDRERNLFEICICANRRHLIVLPSSLRKTKKGTYYSRQRIKFFKDKKVVPYKSWIGNSKHQEASLAHIFVKKCIFLSFWQKADFRYHNALLDCFC